MEIDMDTDTDTDMDMDMDIDTNYDCNRISTSFWSRRPIVLNIYLPIIDMLLEH
jgi:hypothetical protein